MPRNLFLIQVTPGDEFSETKVWDLAVFNPGSEEMEPLDEGRYWLSGVWLGDRARNESGLLQLPDQELHFVSVGLGDQYLVAQSLDQAFDVLLGGGVVCGDLENLAYFELVEAHSGPEHWFGAVEPHAVED